MRAAYMAWEGSAGLKPAATLYVARYSRKGEVMLMLIFVILLVLWLLGMVSSYTLGGYLHILLIVAIAVLLIRIIQGRRPI
jgi:hypothetical protein